MHINERVSNDSSTVSQMAPRKNMVASHVNKICIFGQSPYITVCKIYFQIYKFQIKLITTEII